MYAVGHATQAGVNQEVFTACDTPSRFNRIDGPGLRWCCSRLERERESSLKTRRVKSGAGEVWGKPPSTGRVVLRDLKSVLETRALLHWWVSERASFAFLLNRFVCEGMAGFPLLELELRKQISFLETCLFEISVFCKTTMGTTSPVINNRTSLLAEKTKKKTVSGMWEDGTAWLNDFDWVSYLKETPQSQNCVVVFFTLAGYRHTFVMETQLSWYLP